MEIIRGPFEKFVDWRHCTPVMLLCFLLHSTSHFALKRYFILKTVRCFWSILYCVYLELKSIPFWALCLEGFFANTISISISISISVHSCFIFGRSRFKISTRRPDTL